MCQPGPVVGLAAMQPAELGHGERCDGNAADRRSPVGGSPGELLDQPSGIWRRLRVVPQLCGPYHLTVGIEHDHPVLLTGDTDRFDIR